MTKTITNFAFLLAICVVVLIFFSSKTYPQIAFSIVLYAALIYIGFMIFPRRTKAKKESYVVEKYHEEKQEKETAQMAATQTLDIDRRTFLKLVGATSISFFLFSIFGRSLESLLFSRNTLNPLNTTTPTNTNPSVVSPTENYKISEIDESETSYFGFTNHLGAWFIMKEDAYANSYRYAKGESDFPGNWKNRENLRYDYFHNLY